MSRKQFRIIMLILAVLAPGIASATTPVWSRDPGGTTQNCSFDAGHRICYADFDATVNSPIIDTRVCENFTATWVGNVASEAHVNTANVRWSISETASVNTSGIIDNATLTGDPSTGLDRLIGFDAPWIYVTSTNSAGTGRIAIHCFRKAE
jgi:hypothetical protein